MPAHEDFSSVSQLQDGIDDVLVARGFAPGQGGSDEEQTQIIWCAAADELATRFPALPTSHEPVDGWGTKCTDLVLDLAVTDSRWCVTSVSLEGHDLDEALADLGLAAAAEWATALLGSSARECLTLLPPLLTTLLDASTRPI